MQSIFWHDYETFGADPQRDRPSQFAGIRTDLDLNVIEDPHTFYCKPSEDYLPAPEACLVTGITPQDALREGLCEADFAKLIHEIFSVPQTCVAGYNSLRFDDEVSRNLFYRNFYDPYQREWMNGNSRWDLIDIVRLVYVMRPDCLSWPKTEQGDVSFRLELLTAANGISHESAHDAMSDVYATIELAKLIKQREPKLFDWAFGFRAKSQVQQSLDINAMKPVLHVSSKFSVSKGCCSVVVPVAEHPVNKNAVICFDLRQSPEYLASMTVAQIRERLYQKTSELADGIERPALKSIHVNKCPVVLPASSVKDVSKERREAWQLDLDLIKEHLAYLRAHPELVVKIKEVFSDTGGREDIEDPDLMIYTGGFFGPSDKNEMQRLRNTPADLLAEEEFVFQDSRLPEMLMRYKGRNYPYALNELEQEQWAEYCYRRVVQGESGFLGIEEFGKRLMILQSENEANPRNLSILDDLKCYAESIIPYL